MRGYEDALIDKWQMARYNAYMLYCVNTELKDRKDIYDFHPLPGDPTAEERVEIKKQQAIAEREQQAKRAKAMYERHQKVLERAGLKLLKTE